MAAPIIHVIPDAYWGGGVPKRQTPKEVGGGEFAVAPVKEAKKLSPKMIFLTVVGILFLAVVGASVWYFTRPLRAIRPAPAPQPPASTLPEEPASTPPPPSPEITESPAPAVEPAPLPTPPAPPPSPSQDTDSDGLSQIEEALYGSQSTVPDTDNDGFLDGHEVFHLYNPGGIAPERLEAAGFARRYFNEQPYRYEVLVPTGWKLTASVEGPVAVQVGDANGQIVFEIGIIQNTQSLSLSQWYRSQSPGAPGTTDATDWTSNKFGLQGFLSADSRKAYFADRNYVYTIGFARQDEELMATYKRTFEMMLNSFKIM